MIFSLDGRSELCQMPGMLQYIPQQHMFDSVCNAIMMQPFKKSQLQYYTMSQGPCLCHMHHSDHPPSPLVGDRDNHGSQTVLTAPAHDTA
jgi:hypothetical protein